MKNFVSPSQFFNVWSFGGGGGGGGEVVCGLRGLEALACEL